MAFAENQGVRIYWREQGIGEPDLHHGGSVIPPIPHASHIFETDQPGAAHRTKMPRHSEDHCATPARGLAGYL
jgi:hypothetical protein